MLRAGPERGLPADSPRSHPMRSLLIRRSSGFLLPLALLFAAALPGLRSAASLPPAPLYRVSHAYDGGPALTGAGGNAPSITADGRYVAFASNALNFDPRANGKTQV